MTVRLWARNITEARTISAGAMPDPDIAAGIGELRPFVTDDPILRCVAGCNQLLTADEYLDAEHQCLRPFVEEDDISVDVADMVRSVAVLLSLVIIDIALLLGLVAGAGAIIRWALR